MQGMVSYRRGRVAIAPFFPALSLLAAVPALAQEPAAAKTAPSSASDAPADRYVLTARSESHLQFFQRALLPGPNGAIVTDETAIPFTEYVTVDARDVDAPWQRDSIDVEFAAWGQLWPTSSDYERPFDGDVQVASIRFDGGPAWVRLGRQQVAGGAARFARFDGVMVGAGQSLGFFAEGYGGYGVLPRWNEQPGYHHLGSAEGELIDDDVGAPQERGSNWLAGARAGYTMARLSGSVSFHEQHETGGLERRNLGLDVGAHPFDAGSMGARALLELDSMRLANLRAWIDTHAAQSLDLGAEVSHSEPALLLSRQSVLSVFTT
ncbi:MAG TPA: hypothetical protein VMS65_02340, partial [Polyangiaceae bacterium]|nr:hypothetical protein [Polyangiaceae bacterium]